MNDPIASEGKEASHDQYPNCPSDPTKEPLGIAWARFFEFINTLFQTINAFFGSITYVFDTVIGFFEFIFCLLPALIQFLLEVVKFFVDGGQFHVENLFKSFEFRENIKLNEFLERVIIAAIY